MRPQRVSEPRQRDRSAGPDGVEVPSGSRDTESSASWSPIRAKEKLLSPRPSQEDSDEGAALVSSNLSSTSHWEWELPPYNPLFPRPFSSAKPH